MMLKDAEGFSSFSVDDVDAARRFYGETLGLSVAEASLGREGADVPGGLEFRISGTTRVLIYPKPDHAPAAFTVVNFLVADIERAVDDLTARGVQFERYDTGPRTDAKGIHRNPRVHPVAWFKDPAGNIISIIER
jgi:catechol 2,3-dioxygenase-like lactoylglutathione lyase family enzyme